MTGLSPMISMSEGRKPAQKRRSSGIKIHISPSPERLQAANTRITRKRIFLVDDHPAFRLGLAAIFSTEFDFEVCGEASCAEDALVAIADVQPHLVLTDISMPNVSGLELIRRLGESAPEVKVIAMSVHKDSVYALPVAQAGGYGYLNKETPGDRIVAAIRCVLSGGMSFQQDDIVTDRRRGLPEREASGTVAGIEFLTARELEVFELLGEGFRTREVSEQLGMSIKTAEVHRSNIRRKLSFTSTAEMLHAAYRWVHEQD